MQVFEESFVNAVNEEIGRQLAKGSATRKTVCNALGLDDGFEACISVLLEQGSLPAYRAVKRLGIVRSDYQTGKEKKFLETSEKKDAEPTRQLHPNILVRQQGGAVNITAN